MNKPVLFTLLVLIAFCVLPAGAEEVTTVSGPGLIEKNLGGSNWGGIRSIALCPIDPNRFVKDKEAAKADVLAVEAFLDYQGFKIEDLTKSRAFGVRDVFYNRSRSLHLLNADKIKDIGAEYGVDALWGASVVEYIDFKSHVELKLEVYLYSAYTGKRIWERTVFREQLRGGFKSASESVLAPVLQAMVDDGIKGNPPKPDTAEQREPKS